MGLQERQPRVLIADDDEDICFYLKRYLERRKFQVIAVFDGQEAKVLIEKENFDYLLLDCDMPSLTGLELVETGRRRNPGAKIVLISGFPFISDEMVKNMGGDAFINKPIRMSEIDDIFRDARDQPTKE